MVTPTRASPKWSTAKTEEISALEASLQALGDERRTAQAFLELDADVEALRALQAETRAHQNRVDLLTTERAALLARLLAAQVERDRAYKAAAGKAVSRVSRHVRVDAIGNGDPAPLLELLDEVVPGRLAETRASIVERANASGLRAADFAAAYELGPDALAVQYGLTSAQAQRVCSAGTKVLRRIQELDHGPTLRVALNVSRGGQARWRALERLSTGQKATALLLLALAEADGSGPLIVDQPEDDLDNEFVVEGVVARLRSAKQGRQFVLTTHNPNIPVLADAELVVSLSASGEADTPDGRAVASSIGSIDHPPTRSSIEQLEGGRAAFENRRRLYGY